MSTTPSAPVPIPAPIVTPAVAHTEEVDPDPYHSDWTHTVHNEFKESFASKLRSNPLIPLGAGLTSLALVGGLMAFKSGDHKRSQLFQRARVGLQFGTILALVVGSVAASSEKASKK